MTITDLNEHQIRMFLEENGFTGVDDVTLVRKKYREYITVQIYQSDISKMYVTLVDDGTGECIMFKVDPSRTVLLGELTKNEFRGSLELYDDKDGHIFIAS